MAVFNLLLALFTCLTLHKSENKEDTTNEELSNIILKTVVSDLSSEYTVKGFLCLIAPFGKPVFITDGVMCKPSYIHHFFPSECFVLDTAYMGDDLYLFEDKDYFDDFEVVDYTSLNKENLPSGCYISGLEEYFYSSVTNACFIKMYIPIQTKNSYWCEVSLISRISPVRLHLMLVFDRETMKLEDLWRKDFNDPFDNNPFEGCSNFRVFRDYQFKDSYYIGDHLIIDD